MKFSGPDALPAAWQNTTVPGTDRQKGLEGQLVVGQLPRIRDPRETTSIIFGFKIPTTLEEMLSQGGSIAGFSAVSSFLGCPERARLKGIGVHKRSKEMITEGAFELDELAYGTLIHACLAARVVHGMAAAEWLLKILNLMDDDRTRAQSLMRTYDQTFDLASEPFKYIGVEAEVFTDVGDGLGGSIVRSVRYDTVVQYQRVGASPMCFSLENKTAAKGGNTVADQYMPQFASQVTLWNSNPHLVQQYGPMVGVIPNMLIKTTVPRAERYAPRYISRFLQHRATEYLRLPEKINFPINSDGSSPRMLHSCWGRYRPCDYLSLCWEGSIGDYEQVKK